MSMQRELSQQMESVAIYEHTSSHSIVVRRPRGEQAAVDGNTSRGMVRSSTDAAAAAATLIIECQDREFTVIKSVICDKSPVFRRMCNGNFREAYTGRINLREEDPDTVEVAIQYMSASRWSRFNIEPYAHPLALLSRLYIFGDKYLIPSLTDRAGDKLIVELGKDSWTCEDFLLAVQSIYAMAGRRTVNLRKVFLSRARSRLDELVIEPLFVEIVRNLPEFTARLGNVVRGRARRPPQPKYIRKQNRRRVGAKRRYI